MLLLGSLAISTGYGTLLLLPLYVVELGGNEADFGLIVATAAIPAAIALGALLRSPDRIAPHWLLAGHPRRPRRCLATVLPTVALTVVLAGCAQHPAPAGDALLRLSVPAQVTVAAHPVGGLGVVLTDAAGRTLYTSAAPTGATAQQVIHEFRQSGLPVDGETDTTAKDCATVDCVQALSTSTVLVRSFRTPGQAETYGQGTGAFQIVTVVLTFTGSATPQQQHRYDAAAARVVH